MATPHCKQQFSALPILTAASLMRSASTPQISAAHSGVVAVAPAVAEFLILQVVLDDVVAQGHRYRGIGAGAQLKEHIGLACEPRELRVDGDELRSALHGLHHPVAERAVGVGNDGVVAPDEDVLGRFPPRIVVAEGGVLRIVGDEQAARFQRGAETARRVAGDAREEARSVIRRAEVAGHQRTVSVDVAAGSLGDPDGLGPVRVDDLAHFLQDDLGRLIPGNALERIFAAVFASAFHGVEQTVGVVEHLLVGKASRAEASLVIGVFGIALDLLELAILHVEQDSAVVMASGTRAGTASNNLVFALSPFPFATFRIVGRFRFRHISSSCIRRRISLRELYERPEQGFYRDIR